jgi:vancomycin resistance protein YoaR
VAVVTRDTDRAKLRALLRARTWATVLVPLSALCLVLAIGFAAEWLYQDRALPGVMVAGVDVGSLTRGTLVDRLDQELATPFGDSAVVVSANGRTWRSTNGALGIRPDVAAAADGALAYGKTGSVGDRLGAWIDALRGGARVPFALATSGDALDRWLAQISSDVDRPAIAGSLAVRGSAIDETDPVLGRRLDKITSAASVLAADTLGDRVIDLTVRDVYPEVDASGFTTALAQLRAALTPLDVSVEDRHAGVDAAQLASLVHVQLVTAKPGDLPAIPGDAIAPSARSRYVISLDGDRVAEWVSGLAASLDRPAVDARYSVSKDGVLSVLPGKSGIKVDQEKLKTLLATELLAPSASAIRPLSAPAALDTTSFSTADAEKWLPQLVKTSSFTTYFPVSASRHANIATGSSQFDGVVIQPGATFSFWSLLGPVTPERGYAYAGAIINNRSDESVIGGGLCQVSTTMFNAISKLGYEIVERHEHGYLIERYPLGLDAAVFDPGYDFRWTNDTASPVFLWSWVSDTSVTFDVWGLPTGRTVTFSDPVQRNFVSVPADQPADPAFPAGYAIRGRDVVRTRTVTDASGAIVHQDTFFSHYVPVWGGPAPEGGTLIVR